MLSPGCAGLAPSRPQLRPPPSQACMMTITFLPFTVSHGGSWPPFHPGPSRPPLTPEHALLKALRPMGRCPGPRGCRGFQEPAGSVRGRGWGWGWGGAPSLLANLGSSLQVTHPLLTQQLLDSEGGPCSRAQCITEGWGVGSL